MSSAACSAGEEIFAIGYAAVACIFTLIIVYYLLRLLWQYCRHNAEERPSVWLFCSGVFYVLITVFILVNCIVYGFSQCEHIDVHEDTVDLLYTVILRDLYVIQLYFLWIVLMIRLYFMLEGTAYALSTLSVRIYCVLFIFAPILTIFLSVPWLYTVFVVLGLSGGIFITLSVIIVYIFKLVQVYTHYADTTTSDNNKKSSSSTTSHDVDVLISVTKDTILVLLCTALSLFILFILILNFIFSVYSVEYAAQQQLLDVALLLDAFVTAICVLFQSRFLYPSYAYFCGCVDNVCHYYCNRFVNPSMGDAHAYYYYGSNLKSIAEEAQQGHNRYSMSLGAAHVNTHNAGGVVGGMLATRIVEEQHEEEEMAAMMMHHDEADEVKSPELESLPSLPGGKPIVDDRYLRVRSQSKGARSGVVSPQSERSQRTHSKSREYMLTSYLINYNGIALDKVDQRDIPQLLMNQDSNRIHGVLTKSGFQDEYTKRALAVYEKHYGTEYDIRVIREIIYRLTIKDKLKELKLVQNLYQSREVVEEILIGLNFAMHYVSIALTMYEVMAEMFELDKHHQNIYDLELVTEMIMRLRSKDRERGVLVEDGDNLVMENQQQRRGTATTDNNNDNDNDRRRDMHHTHDTHHQVHYGTASAAVAGASATMPMQAQNAHHHQQQRSKQYEEHAIVTNMGDYERGIAMDYHHQQQHAQQEQRQPVQRMDSNKVLGIVRDSGGHKNQSSLADDHDVLEVTVNTNDMDVDGEYSDHHSDYMQVMQPVALPIQQQQQHQQQPQQKQQPAERQQARRQHLPPPPKQKKHAQSQSQPAVAVAQQQQQKQQRYPNGHYYSNASTQDRSHAHKSKSRSHSQSASPSPSPSPAPMHNAKIAMANKLSNEQDFAVAAVASSKKEGASDHEIYVAYTTLYGAPSSAQALIKFARKRGQTLSVRQAQQIMPTYANHRQNNHNHNHNHSKSSPRSDQLQTYTVTNASYSNSGVTGTGTTRTSDDLRKLSKIQQRIHNDIHNVRDANGNMNDDMDDMDDEAPTDVMDSDADEVTTVETEQQIEPDRFDDADGDGLKSAAEMYKAAAAAKSKQNYLPSIPQIAPNKQQAIISVVTDGRDPIHNQKSESSEREYEEEFYDEEDDEKQMKMAIMAAKNHTHSYERHRSTPPDPVDGAWSESNQSSNDLPNDGVRGYHHQNGNAKTSKVQQK